MRQKERVPFIFGREYKPVIANYVCGCYLSDGLEYFKKGDILSFAKCVYRSFRYSPAQAIREWGKFFKYKLAKCKRYSDD